MNNKKGFSLIITLILSFVAVGFIAALLYLIMSGTVLSGKGKVYTSAIEAAKGLTERIVDAINTDTLYCGGSNTPCSDNGVINTSIINTPGYNTIGTVIKRQEYSKNVGGQTQSYYIYLINIKVNSSTSKDKAEVEFAYEVEK
ncbi:hypothetical protein [Calditerrivibrio nitroreducens]|uniref:Type 4 fimbrial biogenesis protein PilX N-terminal domain-containing protein n=1 Tax=Calditerrivibrio nitroreducens (strain DSM 19672 / NBRC 101217 / Yu37-1) TaxID=768670 RepID=E4TJ41_CALNY|nr:hypothetical protein [Calditerrivibrio nitroreducens]ADR18077.1 hypothetical protein Calni_0164 [Calditerrivibrio nitroreducens DSM 19672]